MKVITDIESRDGLGMWNARDRRGMYMKLWWGNLEERDQSEDLGVDGRIFFKWYVRSGSVAGPCERGNEARDYIKCRGTRLARYGPGVDTSSNRNEYQEYFLGGKGGRCVGLKFTTFMCRLSTKSVSLNLLEPYGHVQPSKWIALPFLKSLGKNEQGGGPSLPTHIFLTPPYDVFQCNMHKSHYNVNAVH